MSRPFRGTFVILTAHMVPCDHLYQGGEALGFPAGNPPILATHSPALVKIGPFTAPKILGCLAERDEGAINVCASQDFSVKATAKKEAVLQKGRLRNAKRASVEPIFINQQASVEPIFINQPVYQ